VPDWSIKIGLAAQPTPDVPPPSSPTSSVCSYGPERRQNTREDAGRYLAAIASTTTQLVAASRSAGRSPRMLLDRQQ
jgi:hypothetical protein